MSVYLYDTDLFPATSYLRTGVRQTVGYNPHFTTNPAEACLFLVLVGEGEAHDLSVLHKLPYWGGDGKCYLLFHISYYFISSVFFWQVSIFLVQTNLYSETSFYPQNISKSK